MAGGKSSKWIKDNLVLLVGIPLIFGIHWGWTKLQDVPYLVDTGEKKDIPIIAAFRAIKERMMNRLNSVTTADSTAPEKSK
ncbi:hypothetical protein JTB14_027336 [Gonioctena quinquepunctata]|nr:hypothetical protein JTB14_027336 [Gonioctena quinquepunctata]